MCWLLLEGKRTSLKTAGGVIVALVETMIAGYLDAHRRWGRLALADVVAPASALARHGVQLSSVQRRFVTLVAELLLLTDETSAACVRTAEHVRELIAAAMKRKR
mgnify:CR=1 FL=1